jgi:C-terminal processing protease CtpA/Prc
LPPQDTAGASNSVLKPGDVVQKIDGRPVEDALHDAEELISAATPQWLLYRAVQQLGAGDPGTELSLEMGEGLTSRTVRLKRVPLGQRPADQRPDKIKELRPGIMYVDIGRIDDADFTTALPELERARGIVFDFRGYPAKLSPLTLFRHLIDKVSTSPQWHIPLVRRPDMQSHEFLHLPGWILIPSKPHFSAKRAFVTDGRAISYAESCLGIIEHYKLGEIVGGPTAGTNGNVNPIELPGGYHITWTGMRVLKHDGSRHHGVGIAPTVPASRTIAGVIAGRDELLEKAIEAVDLKK